MEELKRMRKSHAALFADTSELKKLQATEEGSEAPHKDLPPQLPVEINRTRNKVGYFFKRCHCYACYCHHCLLSLSLCCVQTNVLHSISKVPYPTSAAFDPTADVGVCAEFALAKDQTPATKRGTHIVDTMESVYAGERDADIFARYAEQKLPSLKGNHKDSVTDLPLCIQDGLQVITRRLAACAQQRKQYKVCSLRFFFYLFIYLFIYLLFFSFFFIFPPTAQAKPFK